MRPLGRWSRPRRMGARIAAWRSPGTRNMADNAPNPVETHGMHRGRANISHGQTETQLPPPFRKIHGQHTLRARALIRRLRKCSRCLPSENKHCTRPTQSATPLLSHPLRYWSIRAHLFPWMVGLGFRLGISIYYISYARVLDIPISATALLKPVLGFLRSRANYRNWPTLCIPSIAE